MAQLVAPLPIGHQSDRVEELLPLLLEGLHSVHGRASRLLLKDGMRLEAEPSVTMEVGPGVPLVAACASRHCRLLAGTVRREKRTTAAASSGKQQRGGSSK